MTQNTEFLALPSIVRQALERAAGKNGIEAVNREKPVPVVMVTAEDWRIIHEHLLFLQDSYSQHGLAGID